MINMKILIGRIGPTYIAAWTNIESGGEITSPAENVRLTGMYLQRTSPNTNVFGGMNIDE